MEKEYTHKNYKKETTHIIALLDLLGASGKIMGSESEFTLNILSDYFIKAGTRWLELGKVPDILKSLKYVTFSDNIAFALEISENTLLPQDFNQSLAPFIKYISVFQGLALKNGLLFRGAISVGPLYMNTEENFVWGKSLVEAHLLEENAAIYPRVILHRNLESGALQKMERVRKDFDGRYFVDYIPAVAKLYPDWVEQTKNLIREEFFKADGREGQERKLQKYAWLQKYIDTVHNEQMER